MTNEFDDFLSGPGHDDLDDLHAEAERQLYKNGGIKKAVKKIKGALALRKAKKASKNKKESYSDADVANVVAEGKNQKATKLTKKKSTSAPKPDAKPSRVGKRIETPKSEPKSHAKKLVVKKTIDKVKTKRGTGNTYKATWDADKGGVKGKHKDYASFEKAAKKWNADKASKSSVKPKSMRCVA